MSVIVSYWAKPIPLRQFDHEAVTSDYSGEPSDPIGYGRTAEEATEDLLEQIEAAAPQRQPAYSGPARDGIEAQHGLNDVYPGDKYYDR